MGSERKRSTTSGNCAWFGERFLRSNLRTFPTETFATLSTIRNSTDRLNDEALYFTCLPGDGLCTASDSAPTIRE